MLLTGLCCIACAEKTNAPLRDLPEPDTDGAVSLEQAVANRRSIRSYTERPLTLKEIGQLLWAAQGVTRPDRNYRAAPSAGATYPLETYVVHQGGVFKYLPKAHALQKKRNKDVRKQLGQAALGQRCVTFAPCSIVIAAVPERTTGRYGERGIRYVHMEAGHAAENIHLQAVSLGLGSVPVGAFDGKKVSRVLKLSGNEEPLYIIPVGEPE